MSRLRAYAPIPVKEAERERADRLAKAGTKKEQLSHKEEQKHIFKEMEIQVCM
uniref:Uncharacterized protein n=1 Tax=Arion vulgaris TaxID=1028688 RepID=A0A0B7AW57_9EUPU